MNPTYTSHEQAAPEIRLTGRVVKPLITAACGARNAVMYTGEYEAGRRLPAHTHERVEELIFVLSGSGEIHIGESCEPIRPGCAIYIPMGFPHYLHITSPEPMRILFVFSPPEIPGTAPESPVEEG